MTMDKLFNKPLSRRHLVAGAGAIALAGGLTPGYIQAQSSAPIKLGMPIHRTGIGAAYGKWYERTANAAVKVINDGGGIAGRKVELVGEDDATDPQRAAELMDKFANQHKVDLIFGTLFSHVVIGAAPRAGELKIPYLVCSEGHHVASGLNRYVMQPGITDVKSQVVSMAPWIAKNIGKKITMIYPDFAFGYDHRDYFSKAIEEQGGKVIEKIAIPPVESSFTKYFPKIPKDTDAIYHVLVGPAVLTFVKELGEFYGKNKRPELFGFMDSLEATPLNSPGLEFLEGSYFWEGNPRYAGDKPNEFDLNFRKAVGVDNDGASTSDKNDVSTYSHMFSIWETLFIIKKGMEAAGYKSEKDRTKFIEAVEAMKSFPHSKEHPQGMKEFNGKTHQAFGHQYITKVTKGKLVLAHTVPIKDGYYPDEVEDRKSVV